MSWKTRRLSLTPLAHVPALTVPHQGLWVSFPYSIVTVPLLFSLRPMQWPPPSHLSISSSLSPPIHFLSFKQSELSWYRSPWTSHTKFCPNSPLRPLPSPHALYSGWAEQTTIPRAWNAPLPCFAWVHVAISGQHLFMPQDLAKLSPPGSLISS